MGSAHVFRGNDASENEVRSNLIKVTTGNFHDSNVFPYFFRLLISECFTNPYYPIPRHSLKKLTSGNKILKHFYTHSP